MQFRINSRAPPDFNEYTDIFNKQIMPVGKYSRDRVEELSAKIDQLSNSIKKVNLEITPITEKIVTTEILIKSLEITHEIERREVEIMRET